MLFSRLWSRSKSWRFVLFTLWLSIKRLFFGRNFFLVLMRSCLSTGSVVLQWRRFSILGGKFSDKSKILPLSYNFIRMTLFISLKNADDFYKVFRHKIGSSTLCFIHILIIKNPPLKFACGIFERHLHLGYIEKLNDTRVASLGFFKDSVCTTRINKEIKFKIKFKVLLKFAKILLDYKILNQD